MPLLPEHTNNSGSSKRARKRPLQLGNLLRAGRWLVDTDKDESQMVYWALDDLSVSTRPLPLEYANRRFKKRIENDEEKADAWREVQSTILASKIALDNTEVKEHFQRVTGHSLEDVEGIRIAKTVTTPRAARQRSPRLALVGRRAIASIFALYLVTVGFGGNELALPHSLMEVEGQEISWFELGETSRGVDKEWELEVRFNYYKAFTHMRESRTSVLGWFPGYERAELSVATNLLEDAIVFQSVREVASSRSVLMLARAYMQLNQDDKAAALLQMVIERGDEEAASALNLQDRLARGEHRF